MRCAFCELPVIQERKIIENNLAWAFPSNIPIVPGHVLICPKRCVAKFEDLTFEEKEAIYILIKKLKQSLIKLFNAQGFNYAWNEGKLAGQSVPHFHLHLLPRKEADTGIIEYEPRKFLYRPGERENSPEEELLTIAKEIRKNIE
jgi:diadenosine tetraphosphate (Ap4A) HIT family hydrolase